MRGIVISPIKLLGPTSFTAGSDYLNTSLRNYILYWDKVDIPTNNLIEFCPSPEIEFLKKANVVQQTQVNIMMSGEGTKLYMLGQLKVFENNNRINKGCWSLGQENIEMVLPQESLSGSRGLELDFYQRLPIPTKLVSFEEILEYKFRRRDELLAFRNLMDEFYLEILDSSDLERALDVKANKVLTAINDIETTMNESKISKFRKGIKVSLDVSGAARGASLGTLLTNYTGADVALGAFIGGASKLFNIEISDVFKPRRIPENLSDYAYLYYAKNGYKS